MQLIVSLFVECNIADANHLLPARDPDAINVPGAIAY